jgi:hypothetical protein
VRIKSKGLKEANEWVQPRIVNAALYLASSESIGPLRQHGSIVKCNLVGRIEVHNTTLESMIEDRLRIQAFYMFESVSQPTEDASAIGQQVFKGGDLGNVTVFPIKTFGRKNYAGMESELCSEQSGDSFRRWASDIYTPL